MATKKEIEITSNLAAKAMAVNLVNPHVNANVEITRAQVTLRISPAEVSGTDWEWIFYPAGPAYLSNDTWTEKMFAKRCEAFSAELDKYMTDRDADGVPV